MRIGVCGTGKMGSAMAERLIEVGHDVAVWNRNAAKTANLTARGAQKAATPAALATMADIIITMLFDAAAVEAVHADPDGLLSGDVKGKLFVDCSTVPPEASRAIAAEVTAKGGAFIDCPVGGTVGPAREGKLLGLVGGSDADVARARPILDQLCRRVEHVGPVGAGAAMKLAVNLPLMVYWQALGEALALVAPLGLPPERVVDILADTSGTPMAMKGRAPHIARLLAGEPLGPPAFDVSAARKDLAVMVRVGEELGASMPATSAALAGFTAADEAGFGRSDAINVPVFWSKRPGRRATAKA